MPKGKYIRLKRSKASMRVALMTQSYVNENGCRIWTGRMDSHGYGSMMVNGVRHSTSRVSLHVFKDFDLDSNLDACHNDKVCNSRACIEPEHLYPGTRSQNIRDSVRKGTHRSGFSK